MKGNRMVGNVTIKSANGDQFDKNGNRSCFPVSFPIRRFPFLSRSEKWKNQSKQKIWLRGKYDYEEKRKILKMKI